VRPWSAIVCGLSEDRTLLVVDWLLLACREAGLVGQAVPLADATDLHGMYVEIAADAALEGCFGELPWGSVDLVVAGEHLELLRAIDAGFVDPDITTVVSSCRRAFTDVEQVVAPQHVLDEREIDAIAIARSLAYYAFDGHEVARWYGLPAAAQPGLLLGAVFGSEVTGLDEQCFQAAIDTLGIDADLQQAAFGRGTRLGRRAGGRVRRVRTAYQFTRRRRALVDHHSRREFEELVARAEQVVQLEHVPVLQEAIFQLCEFQNSAWAAMLVDHVDAIASAERDLLGELPAAHRSVVPDSIRSLAAMMVWPDGAWIANRKIRRDRLKQLRAAHGITRRERYDLVEYIPLDALERAASRSRRVPKLANSIDPHLPPLLQPLRVEQIITTTIRGALRLRRLAASSRNRAGSARERLELDSVEAWLQTIHDALRVDHEIALIVARSGTLVQGSGAVREANRATAHAFWGRIVRQSIALDRGAEDGGPSMAAQLVPFAWEQLCRSGPLALWEYAAQVLGIALARSRGLSIADTRALVDQLCHARRPVEGA
jgi:indolepyruvate ferredoxin oxidoreductase beta subunit